MKKTLRIILPIVLAIAILACSAWYLFVYDRTFTRDILLTCARTSENNGNHNVAKWFYDLAYSQSDNSDMVAIELAQQYKKSGNYTKAEFTLYNAIADGAGIDVYIALSKIYVEQDKLIDAVNMLSRVSNETIKAELEAMRPAAPTATPDPGFYSQYISVSLAANSGTIYYSGNGEYPSVNTTPYSNPITLSDGENSIYAVAIADNGLVSPLSIFGFTVGGVIEEINFSDELIEAEIRTLLSVGDDTSLYTNDLWAIKEFTIPEGATDYTDLKNLIFLEKLTINNGVGDNLSFISSLANLTYLHISNTSVSTEVVSSIGALPMLKELTLSECGITSIAGLENAVGITKLDLNNNAIRNIDALSKMTGLQELNLKYNALTSLAALSNNTAITKLDISTNSIASLAPLSNLTALTRLDASVNSITELGDIGNLKALEYLSLSSNSLTDISSLSGCTAITELNIATNNLADISSLTSITNLAYLDFSYNEVTSIPTFSKSCALVTINGSHNKLSSLQNLSGLEHLNRVDMDYNEGITSVKALTNCPVLLEVNVYGTGVTDVTALTNQCIVVNYNPVK